MAPHTTLAHTDRPGPDSAFEPGSLERSPAARRRGLGRPQTRLLAALLVLACLGLALWARQLTTLPWIDAQWRVDAGGAIVLADSRLPALAGSNGQTLVALSSTPGGALEPDALLLHGPLRWQVKDADRDSQARQQSALATLLAAGEVQLRFADGSSVTVKPAPRGLAGLGPAWWFCSALALALLGLGCSVLLLRPQARNALYLLMAAGQAGHLVLLAAASLPGLGTPWPDAPTALGWSLCLDALTSAAAVHALLLHPRRQPGARLLGVAAWGVAGAWAGLVWLAPPAGLWWWAQGMALASAAAGWWLAGRSRRIEPNPFALLIQRLTGVVAASLLAVTGLVALASAWPDTAGPAATLGAWAWCLVPSGLLLLAPFMSRSRQMLVNAALLVAAAAVAAASHKLFMAWLSLGDVSASALAVGLGLALVWLVRPWALGVGRDTSGLDAERAFEQIYRAARDLQAQPGRYRQLLSQLLRDVFDPREVLPGQRDLAQARVVGGGAALEVPLRGSSRPGQAGPTLVLRFAGGGRRLFTDDDARLADRLVERLRRAVAYDRAVERGRSEERQRIAQDLHDDIGARLLTLMYRAQTPAMEEYIRLTLKDLKTLTRGLAAGEHRLSHAAGEWKADLDQRLAAAQVQLLWTFSHDRDVALTMVQWSALTRVLRELVSNVLQHARASQVSIQISLEGSLLLLRVSDNGCGRDPERWSHGLGLGGVRKRVKLIGGHVSWRDQAPQGIVCEVQLDKFLGIG